MRKRIIAVSLSLLFLFSGCSDKDSADESTITLSGGFTAEIVSANNLFDSHTPDNPKDFVIFDKIGNQYYGMKLPLGTNAQWDYSQYSLIDINTNKETRITMPDELKNQPYTIYMDYVTLSDRYLYCWGQYDDIPDANTRTRSFLTCLDTVTGKTTIIDKSDDWCTGVTFRKIDNDHFISYIVTLGYDNVNTNIIATIYDSKGGKKKIFYKEFSSNSTDINEPAFTGRNYIYKDGKNYIIDADINPSSTDVYLYEYSENGKYLNKQKLTSLPDSEDRYTYYDNTYFVGNYIVTPTTGSSQGCIIKNNSGNGELITTPAEAGQLNCFITQRYSDNTPYIVFFADNWPPPSSSTPPYKNSMNSPLYFIDTKSEKIKGFTIPPSLKELNFGVLQTLSNGDVMLSYYDGDYTPSNVRQFIIPADKIAEVMNE